MQKLEGKIKNIPTLTDEKLTQQLIPARFIPETPEHLKDKNIEYIFDRSYPDSKIYSKIKKDYFLENIYSI